MHHVHFKNLRIQSEYLRYLHFMFQLHVNSADLILELFDVILLIKDVGLHLLTDGEFTLKHVGLFHSVMFGMNAKSKELKRQNNLQIPVQQPLPNSASH